MLGLPASLISCRGLLRHPPPSAQPSALVLRVFFLRVSQLNSDYFNCECGDVLPFFFFLSEKSIEQIKDNSAVSVFPWAPLNRSRLAEKSKTVLPLLHNYGVSEALKLL